MNATELPFKIRIASPCTARWEDMGGDSRVRFCDHCRKNVYNLSAMSAEATALLTEKQGRLCARIYQRSDGTVLTEDCPVGVTRYWRRVKSCVAAGVAVTILALAHLSAFGRDRTGRSSENRFIIAAKNAEWKVKGWLGINPPPRMLMGDIAMPVTVPSPPVNPPPASKK